MSLPTKNTLLKLDFGMGGVPFCQVPGNSSISLDSLDYGKEGLPFWGVVDEAAPSAPDSRRVCIIVIT